jgi:hypothetical protein
MAEVEINKTSWSKHEKLVIKVTGQASRVKVERPLTGFLPLHVRLSGGLVDRAGQYKQ